MIWEKRAAHAVFPVLPQKPKNFPQKKGAFDSQKKGSLIFRKKRFLPPEKKVFLSRRSQRLP
jgi:hypothetical protein